MSEEENNGFWFLDCQPEEDELADYIVLFILLCHWRGMSREDAMGMGRQLAYIIALPETEEASQ